MIQTAVTRLLKRSILLSTRSRAFRFTQQTEGELNVELSSYTCLPCVEILRTVMFVYFRCLK